MTLDQRDRFLEPLHKGLSAAVQPVRMAANMPTEVAGEIAQKMRSRRELISRVRELEDQQLLYEARLQKLDALEIENIRLRELLQSSYEVEESVLIAELMRVDLDPYTHLIQIDKGAGSGVHAGQPVLDAGGVIGQVDQVGPFTASVRLITDPSHAIPVEVNRNGIRAVLVGSGNLHRLKLTGLPNNTDVAKGDLLISSGLGGRFPAGYPVARVSKVTTDPGQPFAKVVAKPAGALDRIQEVLLVRRDDDSRRLAGSRSGTGSGHEGEEPSS